MKRLKRVILVNWYLLDAVEVAIEGHSAFIGPNASGKSSILDAIQTVLMGAHGHYLSLNPSAGERSQRSLRDYCLGVVRDPENPEQLSDALKPRPQAITYLVLAFQDDRDGTETTVGVAMHASLDQAKESIDGRFVAPGLSPSLFDFIEGPPDARRPIPWIRVRDELRRRCPELRVEPHPTQFVRRLCADLSHDGREPLDADRFLKNFRNAITFTPIRNVSEFVRRFILEPRPIQVRELQSSLRRYRDIHAKTREVKERIAALQTIDHKFDQGERAEQRAQHYAWAEKEAELLALEVEREPQAQRLEQLDEERRHLEQELARLATEGEQIQQAINALEVEIGTSDIGQRRARIDAERKAADAQLAAAEKEIGGVRRDLGRVWPVREALAELPAELAEPVEALARLLPREDDLTAHLWPEESAPVAAAVAALLPRLDAASQRLKEQVQASRGRLAASEHDLAERRGRLKRLEKGEADLEPATRTLQQLLGGHGIAARPLCDLIDVADERWRDAVERYLGGQSEALVVDPAQADEAVRRYRRERRGQELYGARIVNTRQTDAWLERAERGSLAEVIVTSDPHARAYCNRLLGRVLRADSEEELLRHERAITDDGMLHSNGAISRMRPVPHKLGRAARERQLQAMQQAFQEESVRFYGDKQQADRLDALRERLLQPWLHELGRLPDLAGACERRTAALLLAKDLDSREQALDSDGFQRLQRRLEERRTTLAGCKEQTQRQQTQLHACNAEAVRVQAVLGQMELQIGACGAERAERAHQSGFDMVEASALFERLEAEVDAQMQQAAYRTIAAKAAEQMRRNRNECDARRNEARQALAEYRARHDGGGDAPAAGELDHWALHAWAKRQRGELEQTTLADYEEQASQAMYEAEQAFRGDFVARLRENLSLVEAKRQELNRTLRHRPFHGETYSFKKREAPGFESIIRWIESMSEREVHNVGGLFDEANFADNPHREAIQRVRQLLMDEAEETDRGEGLADYRNYYSFDVEMRDPSGSITTLSRRIGKGSGGEHQSPFYVAIGAALAATYRLGQREDGRVRGGMALAVFDEAFSKLDVQNTTNALEFLHELGLQVLLAAPDEKHALMSEHMDTIVNVYRTGGAVDIDVEYPSARARELLAADNPTHRLAELVGEAGD